MNEETAIVERDESIRLGAITVSSPRDVVVRATEVANELAKIIRDKKLYSSISGKEFVRVEGWTTLGAMLGVIPREVSVSRYEDGTYEAVVELVRVSDTAIIGRGSAICGTDEKTWGNRPEYARRSMATTRATGKAYRLAFSWIMALAGYEVTPLEEMDIIEGEVREARKPTTKSKPANGNRPYAPATVRDKLQSRITAHELFNPTEAQFNLLRYGLELCFIGKEGAVLEDARHTLLNYLIGKNSSKNVTGQEFKALVEDWLDMQKDEQTGDYTINDYARQEANSIISAPLRP